MNPLRMALPLIAGAAVLCGPARAQQPPTPPETEAEAVRMLVSVDYRERDLAMDFVATRLRDGLSVSSELRDAMIRALDGPAWSAGRPRISHDENPDGWGEQWSIYADVVTQMRDPAAIPFMLTEGLGSYDLAAIGRPALLPVIEALEDPAADMLRTVDLALRALTLMVDDGLPTEDELERIGDVTRYRMEAGLMPGPGSSAFGLAVTLGTPELLAMIERAANDRGIAAAMMAGASEDFFIDLIQELARAALQPGFVPVVIRNRRR